MTDLKLDGDHTGDELIDPVIQHTERITKLEGGLTQTEERLNTQLIDTERRLREAIDANAAQETIRSLENRIVSLEAKLEEMATHPVETTETVPAQAATLVIPEVEETPAPPEKERRSIRHKRRGKRKKS